MTPSSQTASKIRELGSLKIDLISLQTPKSFFKKGLVSKVSDQPESPHFQPETKQNEKSKLALKAILKTSVPTSLG